LACSLLEGKVDRKYPISGISKQVEILFARKEILSVLVNTRVDGKVEGAASYCSAHFRIVLAG
jgi:hypothetical protein